MRKYLPKMRKRHSLDALFPKTRQGVLAATLIQPDKAWYVSELAPQEGPPSSLQRELSNLTDAGILIRRRQGQMAYYQANRDAPVFADLRGLLLKTAGVVDIIAEALAPMRKNVHLAFVYGSMASGDERSDSDVDLMVVGNLASADLALPLRRVAGQLGRPVNPTVYTPAEFAAKRRRKDHFLSAVLDKPRLIVLGDTNGLEGSAR